MPDLKYCGRDSTGQLWCLDIEDFDTGDLSIVKIHIEKIHPSKIPVEVYQDIIKKLAEKAEA